MEYFLKSYDNFIQPIRGMRLSLETDYPVIEPLIIIKKPRRSKHQKRKDKDEPKKG